MTNRRRLNIDGTQLGHISPTKVKVIDSDDRLQRLVYLTNDDGNLSLIAAFNNFEPPVTVTLDERTLFLGDDMKGGSLLPIIGGLLLLSAKGLPYLMTWPPENEYGKTLYKADVTSDDTPEWLSPTWPVFTPIAKNRFVAVELPTWEFTIAVRSAFFLNHL